MLILAYHGVVAGDHSTEPFLYRNTVSAREFESQLRLLKDLFHPVRATDVLAHYEDGDPLPPRPVLITFDDGYRNNLSLAAPILSRLGVPALFHITTSYIGSRQILWPDEVNLRVLFWPTPRIPLPSPDGVFPEQDAPPTDSSRIELAQRIRNSCKRLPESVRVRYLDLLRQTPSPSLELVDPELFALLDWPEVQALSGMGFEIGSHTVTHPILSRIAADQVEVELEQSRARLEQATGTGCQWFAYPNGRPADFSPAVVESVRKYYRLAFTVAGAYASLGGDRYTLSRINVPGHQPMAVFESCISGLHRVLSRPV